MDTTDENDTDTQVDQNDDFDAAFNDASAEPGDEPATKVKAEEATDEGTGAGNEPDDGTDAGEPTGDDQPSDNGVTKPDADPASKSEPEGTAPPAADVKPEPVAPQPDQLDPKFLAQAIAEAQAQREAEQKNQPAPEQEAKPLTREDFLNEADAATVKKFETEWPDEYSAVQKLLQAELRAAIGNSFNSYTKQLNGVLAPLMDNVQKVEVNTYRGAVTAAHPDAFEIAPKVAEWIETQPSFVRSAYKQAYEKGTAQEAIELLNLYKTATGSTGAAPATPASSAAQETPPKPKPAVDRQAVKALAAVPAAQRPKPTGGADILDFDAAFAEAAESLANS